MAATKFLQTALSSTCKSCPTTRKDTESKEVDEIWVYYSLCNNRERQVPRTLSENKKKMEGEIYVALRKNQEKIIKRI